MAAPLLGHTIRYDADYQKHIDYIPWNPVKHGYVNRVTDWPHSTFSRLVEKGVYSLDWEAAKPIAPSGNDSRIPRYFIRATLLLQRTSHGNLRFLLSS